jgi:hypothetical protein
MRGRRSWRTRWITVLAVAALFVGATYALTAANTVPGSKAGDGSGAISGYVLSSIHYNLNSTSPGNMDSVTFTLDSTPPAGSTIKAQLDAAGSWYTCTNSGTSVTCTTTSPQATVAGATQLRVIVSQ